MPRWEGAHRWLRSRGSHGPLEPRDQDKRGGESAESVHCPPWKAAWGCSLGPPWPTCGIQEISMSLSTDGWSPPTDFTTVQMIRPQPCETHMTLEDQIGPNDPLWSASPAVEQHVSGSPIPWLWNPSESCQYPGPSLGNGGREKCSKSRCSPRENESSKGD